jgi:hypothetical protein
MPTPSEIRTSLPDRMATLKISAVDLSRLVGWSAPQMCGFLSGKRAGMGIEEMNRVHFFVVELEQLAARLAPIPLNFSNIEAIRTLLAASAEDLARMKQTIVEEEQTQNSQNENAITAPESQQ